MLTSKFLMAGIVAIGLALGAPAPAAEPHAHGNHADKAAAAQLRLDHGKKWQTDDALRRGMSGIRGAMAEALGPIHKNAFTPAQYDALAADIQVQIDYVVGNCKLPETADQQLHLVLEQIIDGVGDMKAAKGRDQGAEKIVRALAQYGKYFDHARWQPLEH